MIREPFQGLTDPRMERAQRHDLLDIIALTICAVICGADNWVEIAEFGQAKAEWLGSFLALPNGIPSHDTLGRVFSRRDPEQFRPGVQPAGSGAVQAGCSAGGIRSSSGRLSGWGTVNKRADPGGSSRH